MTPHSTTTWANVDRIGSSDLDAVAALHAICFEEAWKPHLMRRILSGPGAFGLFTRQDDRVVGFILCRSVGAEVKSVGAYNRLGAGNTRLIRKLRQVQ